MTEIELFKSQFPEDLYVPAWNNSEDYIQRVFFGLGKMSQSSITIGFLVRNIESLAYYTILRINRIAKLFNRSNIVCFENGSKDNTRIQIKKLGQAIDSFYIVGDSSRSILGINNTDALLKLNRLGYQTDKSFARCQRMALVRNILRDNMLQFSTDYYMVIDGDVTGGYSYEGIANTFSHKWDVCASNSLIYKEGIRLYYDSWAFRHLGHPEPHNDEEINTLVLQRGESPLHVMSAFGGLAIYNNDFFTRRKYRYNDSDCDHPTIHIPMYNDGAKIIMNPSMISLYNKTRYVV